MITLYIYIVNDITSDVIPNKKSVLSYPVDSIKEIYSVNLKLVNQSLIGTHSKAD